MESITSITSTTTVITSVWDETKAEWVNETKTESTVTETRRDY